MPATIRSAEVYAPGSIGNLGPGLDVLGLAVAGAGDTIHADVPVFYRARSLATTATVHGVLYHGRTPVTNHPFHLGPRREDDPYSTNYIASTTTGAFGQFIFTNIPSGRYWLILAEAVGDFLTRLLRCEAEAE